MRRSLAYLTLAFTLLLPLVGALWVRSYLHDEMFYRVGHGRALMLSCTRGEVALWYGPARETGPVRYVHRSSESGFAMTAKELLSLDVAARQYWLGGFGYGVTYHLTPQELGPVRCAAVPLWFVTLVAAAFPARVLLRHVRRNQAQVAAELARCRRCGAQLSAGEIRCQSCSFPAFVRHGSVA